MAYVDPRLKSNTNYFITEGDPLTVRAEDWNGNQYGGERIERTCATVEEAQNLLHELQEPARKEAEDWAKAWEKYRQSD